MCGATLPIWNYINDQLRDKKSKNSESSHLKVMRAQTTLGEKIVGLRLASISPEVYQKFVDTLKETIENRIEGRAPEEQPEVRSNRFYSDSEP